MIFTWLVVLSSFSIVWVSVPPIVADDLVSVVVVSSLFCFLLNLINYVSVVFQWVFTKNVLEFL